MCKKIKLCIYDLDQDPESVIVNVRFSDDDVPESSNITITLGDFKKILNFVSCKKEIVRSVIEFWRKESLDCLSGSKTEIPNSPPYILDIYRILLHQEKGQDLICYLPLIAENLQDQLVHIFSNEEDRKGLGKIEVFYLGKKDIIRGKV